MEENGAEIRIEKQRNGPTGHFHLRFNRGSTRFENIAEPPAFRRPPPRSDFTAPGAGAPWDLTRISAD